MDGWIALRSLALSLSLSLSLSSSHYSPSLCVCMFFSLILLFSFFVASESGAYSLPRREKNEKNDVDDCAVVSLGTGGFNGGWMMVGNKMRSLMAAGWIVDAGWKYS